MSHKLSVFFFLVVVPQRSHCFVEKEPHTSSIVFQMKRKVHDLELIFPAGKFNDAFQQILGKLQYGLFNHQISEEQYETLTNQLSLKTGARANAREQLRQFRTRIER